jgi:hypothetical protein
MTNTGVVVPDCSCRAVIPECSCRAVIPECSCRGSMPHDLPSFEHFKSWIPARSMRE